MSLLARISRSAGQVLLHCADGGIDPSVGIVWILDNLKRLSAVSGPLMELGGIIDFEVCRSTLVLMPACGDAARDGQLPYDPFAMFKLLAPSAPNNVGDARIEYRIGNRPSWPLFVGFELGAPTLQANTIRMFRDKLNKASALDQLDIVRGQIVELARVTAPEVRRMGSSRARPVRSGLKSLPVRRRRT